MSKEYLQGKTPREKVFAHPHHWYAEHDVDLRSGELVTGLIYRDKQSTDMHANLNTVDVPLNGLSEKDLCPGAKSLDGFNASHR